MSARALLETPPAIVLGFYIVAIGIPMLLEPALPYPVRGALGALLDWSSWICAVMWAFALFSVAHQVARIGPAVLGRGIFAATLMSFIVSIAIQVWLGPPVQWMASPATSPLIVALFFMPLFCGVIALGLAASAFDISEGGDGWPFKGATVWTCFAMLFLPVGIWFLRARLQRLLAKSG